MIPSSSRFAPTTRPMNVRSLQTTIFSLVFTGLLILPPQVQAYQITVAQPLEPTFSGEFSNLGPSNQQVADDFQLIQATTIQSMSWFGRYVTALSVTNPVSFSVRFFADAGSSPAMSPLREFNVTVDAVPTGLGFNGTPWFEYSTNLMPFTLDPGAYWLSVLETDPQTPTAGNSQWLWADSGTRGARAFRGSDGEAWTSSLDIDHAFTLTGVPVDVPEPSTVLLIATGLIGVAGLRRRRLAA